MEITDENGTVVWSEGNENVVVSHYDTGQENPVEKDPKNPLENNQFYEWTENLPSSKTAILFHWRLLW